LKALTDSRVVKLWLLTAAQNAYLIKLIKGAHTLNLSTQLKISNLVSTTHKECWGELAGQRKALGSSRIAREPAAHARGG
jgi:hypothetical protein